MRSDPPPLIDGLRQLVDADAGRQSWRSPEPRLSLSAKGAVALRRTAQEGLTNAAKHAPGSVAKVHLDFRPDEVVLTVTDAGGARNAAPGSLAQIGGGYGIEGLRERAELLGGTLTAGPDGGLASHAATACRRGYSVSDDAPPLRIVVADDQRAVREALATVLDAEPGLEVVGLAADGDEAVELAHRFSPDVVLMDLRMPNVDGVVATQRLATELPDVKVVVLTTFADDSSMLAALEAGALGFLTKDAGRDQIALAVRSAAAGQAVLDPSVQASLLRAASPAGTASPPVTSEPTSLPDDLTPREADVLRASPPDTATPRLRRRCSSQK